MSGAVTLLPVTGVGEVGAGDDLAGLLADALAAEDSEAGGLRDGDVLVVTSKVVSKAEGRRTTADKADVIAGETDRVLARRGRTSIVRTRHGLVLAGAGIDASNTAAGTVLLLPRDPDASARRLREGLLERTGRNVAVVVTDTAGRAWRNGQTDLAIGAAGLDVLHVYAGREDGYGNELAVTAPAVADEIASAADLVKAKLARRPAAVLRGLGELVRPAGDHGPGAATLVRDEAGDMFGLGSREAVLAAVAADPSSRRGFGAPAPAVAAAAQLGAAPRGVLR
ncbi:MAG: coenzyme F420-0:L-glutamate ligase, partial [Nocardioides sp.]